MDQSRPTTALVAVLTILTVVLNPAHTSRGVSHAGPGATVETPAPAPLPAGAPKAAAPPAFALAQEPLQPVIDYFRVLRADQNRLGELDHSAIRRDEKSTVQFLIATLPDPIDSRFGHRFDLALDSIQSAIEAMSYVPDRYWFPWTDGKNQLFRGRREPTRRIGASAPGDSKWEQYPGCIVYRRVRHPDDLLVLFLVGETPTWGIHKVAFSNSLRFGAELLKMWGALENRPPVRIIGPYFSGSAASMERALYQWIGAKEDPFGTFYVCTGSATGIDRDEFQKDSRNGQPEEKVVFWSTVLPDDAIMRELFRYLSGTTGADERIALLTESDTKFGANIQHVVGHIGEKLNTAKDRRVKDLLESLTYLRFPLHISDVRSAYGDSPSKASSNEPRLVTPIDKIPVPFEDSSKARDLVPTLSPKMTMATENLLISRILSTISREGFRFVGIAATDTRDKIFLISLIREYCPDVQIFFTDNDLLLAYPEYSRFLRGSIVASTYPLFPPNREWSPPHRGVEGEVHHRMLFAYEGDQGYYNATIALVDPAFSTKLDPKAGILDDLRAQEYGMPFLEMVNEIKQSKDPSEKKRERRLPAGVRGANIPVWISVIGQAGAWPVEVRRPVSPPGPDGHQPRYELTSGYQADVKKANPEHAKHGFLLICPDLPLTYCALFAALTFFCLFVCCVTIKGRGLEGAQAGGSVIGFQRPPPGGLWFIDLFRLRDSEHQREQTGYILAYLTIMAIEYGVIAFPCFIEIGVAFAAGTAWDTVSQPIWISPIFATVTLGLIAYTAYSQRPPRRPGTRTWDALRIASSAATAIVGTVIVAEALFVSWDGQERLWSRHCFSFQRIVHLVSGISPAIPVLLLAAAARLWVLYQLKRLYLLDRFRVGCPYPGTADGPFGKIIEADREIRSMLRDTLVSTVGRPVSILVATVLLVVAWGIHGSRAFPASRGGPSILASGSHSLSSRSSCSAPWCIPCCSGTGSRPCCIASRCCRSPGRMAGSPPRSTTSSADTWPPNARKRRASCYLSSRCKPLPTSPRIIATNWRRFPGIRSRPARTIGIESWWPPGAAWRV